MSWSPDSLRKADGLTVLAVGLMSGTSADGIDAAVARLTLPAEGAYPLGAELLAARTEPFSPQDRAAILSLCDPATGTVDQICQMNAWLGRRFAEAALLVIDQAGLHPEDIDLIGSHGQTVYHVPPGSPAGSIPSTLQLGEPSEIAERTGITTVADFRPRDIAAGGQGAPLTSFVDYALFGCTGRIVLNLGGIANITALPDGAGPDGVFAFDTGPANMLLDFAVAELTQGRLGYDRDGALAAAGQVSPALLERLLAHPYLQRPPPKTTGREEFGAAFGRAVLHEAAGLGLSVPDILATLTTFTAESVAQALRRFVLPRGCFTELVLGGGGARNPVLVRLLRERLPELRFTTHEQYGIASKAKEALAFAALGAYALAGRPNTLPSCTGARHAVVMGKIVPGRNFGPLMRRLAGPSVP